MHFRAALLPALLAIACACAPPIESTLLAADLPGNEEFDAAPSSPPEESEEPALELAERVRFPHKDPNVDLATPQGSLIPQADATGDGYPPWEDRPAESPWVHLGLYGNGFYWLLGGPNYFGGTPQPPAGPDVRSGAFQRLIATGTYLGRGDDRTGMGVTDFELKTVLACPLPGTDMPLIITPGFGAHFFDGPSVTDVPGSTYDTYVDLRVMRQLSERVGMDAAITPGWYSDWHQDSSDALRIGARAIFAITYSPTVQIVLGAAYLDRQDVNFLPVGGVIWNPSPDMRYELILPRPKIARAMSAGCDRSRWLYVAGEFGGGSWAIERQNGADDVMNYRDYRAVLGFERTAGDGFYHRLEAGYVFGREIEYVSGTPSFSPDSTFLVRAEASY